MLKTLKGDASPRLVAAARGVLEAAILAALGAIAYYINGDSLPAQWAPLAPLLWWGIRALEGYVDHKLDPKVDRAPVAAAAEAPASAPTSGPPAEKP